MTSTTSSSTTEEDMEKLRASLREEVLGTKRLNDYFELRLLPTTQEYSVHCNPVSEKEYTGWILDRLMPKKSLSQQQHRAYIPPPNDVIFNDKVHKKLSKKNLKHLIEKRNLVESLTGMDNFITDSNIFNNKLELLRKNLEKSYRDPHLSVLRHFTQLMYALKCDVTFQKSNINLENLINKPWNRGDSTNLSISMLLFKTGHKYQYNRFELDASKSNLIDTVNHGVELLLICYEQEEFFLYNKILRSRTKTTRTDNNNINNNTDNNTNKKKGKLGGMLWRKSLKKVKNVTSGRKKAKDNIKIVVLDTQQYNNLVSKYLDLYGSGGSNDKIRVLKESEFTNTFHILHGNNNLKGKAVSTIILAITPSWEMSDVLQALTFSRKKVVIVETVEDVGKYLSEKDGEETIRINNLVFEKGKKTQ